MADVTLVLPRTLYLLSCVWSVHPTGTVSSVHIQPDCTAVGLTNRCPKPDRVPDVCANPNSDTAADTDAGGGVAVLHWNRQPLLCRLWPPSPRARRFIFRVAD